MSEIKKISPHGDSIAKFFNPIRIFLHLFQYKHLIRQLTWREVAGKYKGSLIGIGWSFIHPLLMLFVYTFVFSVIFNARWGTDVQETRASFALALFMGLVTFNIFSETLNAAPLVIMANVNYVKKVVFPLEILVMVKFLAAVITALFGIAVLLVGMMFIHGAVHQTLILLPIVWLPMMMFTLGWAYFLASLGVFIRDVGATIGFVTSMLLFLTPIFYPASAVPEEFDFVFKINPLAVFVEDSRRVVLWGLLPDWQGLLFGLMTSVLIFIGGFIWFMKTKKAFADVI